MHIRLKSNLLAAVLLCFAFVAQAQQKKDITLEDIYQKGTFRAKSVYGVNWMSDGRYYSSQVPDEKNRVYDIVKYDVTTGQPVNTIIEGENLVPAGSSAPIQYDDYTFSSDEQKVLFSTETEPIYRRSSKAEFYIYDIPTKKLTKLSSGGKQMYATFSPDAKRVAFARENNMFVTDLSNMQETQITTDGKFNSIINGYADWVYEEEFSFAQGFHWSPDGKKIAFYTFNETNVPEYNMQMWGDLYPQDYKFKYPKAGEANSAVKVSVYDVNNGKTVKMDTGNEADIYIPRIKWTNDANLLSIQKMTRLQNTLEILHANATTGKANVVLKETDKAYIDVTDDLTYLKDGKYFIHSSEVKGYNHLYLYNMNGKLVRQITAGNWEVSEFVGYDEKNDRLYYMSTEVSPLDRHLYSISSKGKKKQRLTHKEGTHRVNMSNDFKYYLDYYSAANTVPTVSLHTAKDGKLIKLLEDNSQLKNTLAQFDVAKQEFFSMNTPDGTKLNGWMIKPTDFDPNKKYPVLMFVYGGPGSQTVTNSWGGSNYLWHQVLADKGVIVVSVDNRGTGARGAEFKKVTYANLGKYEIEDQIEAAKWLGKQPYIDKDRIGIWGHSFGGYMTLLGLTKGDGVFAAGISVAPVTNWRFYDTIYTERFLKTPQENAAGYDDNSPLNFADQLQGELLLIHGTGDDNVHFQNAVAMQDALISANKQFESFYYPNRNHSVGGGITSLHRFKMMTDFLERKLINKKEVNQ
ncbi:S9 family peptidase [Pontibacter korlensis]|uniref:Peptidase S9 n=1 Tax=Pontibacter korlensis TaxID=400092 RepID=A0A0E3ZD20_9BACT|nr:S9 family peptidase [Pontibacter korlensis]AKD02925.1 peptidase S9 [Pontibacter korlensis]